ncbi:MAG: MarR family transcriptional regulator [Planctomycetes bacterium]|nr:MarR family transcriptional regulator [Planctomycetota bacterium]
MALPGKLRLQGDDRVRLGAQLLRLAHRYDRALELKLAPSGLAPTHFEVLKLLYAAPEYSLRHSELARALGITLPSVTVAIRKLSGAGLIGQRRGSDKRERIASLTVRGAEILATLFDASEDFALNLFGAIAEKEAKSVERGVQALLARLSALEDVRVSAASKGQVA